MEELPGRCPRLEGDGDGPVAVLVAKVGGAAEPAFGVVLLVISLSPAKIWDLTVGLLGPHVLKFMFSVH